MQRLPLVPVLLLLASTLCNGQNTASTDTPSDETRPRFGVYGDVNLNLHTARFTALPGVPNCCPEFRSGLGFGPTIGLFFEAPLSSSFLLSLRGGYSIADAMLSRDEFTTVEMDGKPVRMTIEHTIESSLGSIGFEPLVSWNAGEGMLITGGARFGYMLESNYVQQEKISDEMLRGTFENGRRTRHESEGEIPGASAVQASLLGGIAYEVPLNSNATLLAAPELLFSYSLTPLSSDVTWRAHALRGGVALKYSPKEHIEPPPLPPTEPPMPVIPTAAPLLAARVTASGVDAEGVEHPTVRLQVEEFIATESYPLLNYIFFEENSSVLSDRYTSLSPAETAHFATKDLKGEGALRAYHQVLNVVGERMRKDPSTVLKLVGTNADVGPEEGNTDLSRARAESVRDYLKNVWSISDSRISIDERNLPALPSNTGTADGQSENRRVELHVIGGDVLGPVVIDDTLRRATPPVLRFRPGVTSEAGIASWEITSTQDERILKRLTGSGEIPEVLDWTIDQESETMPRAPGRIFYQLKVTDRSDQVMESTVEAIGVEQVTLQKKRSDRAADVEIRRYSLILFGYDDSHLSSQHRTVLQAIGSEIAEDARVIVRGHADRTGEDERNRTLARERAEQVAKVLGVPGDRLEVSGSTDPLYDNDIPEGRFYSRTVTIEVRTPIVDGDSG